MTDILLKETLEKIDKGAITAEDLNKLIAETTPESIRDRIRRRTVKNSTASHIDKPSGHQPLSLPSFTKRVAPKRKPANQQNHGRSKIAHKHSTQTQRQNAVKESILFVKENVGKPIRECSIRDIDVAILAKVAKKMMALENINRDWLNDLLKKIENG